MARHDDDMRNLDDEWQRFAATLDDGGNSRRGPRDWSPGPEVIDQFNPADLPESEPLSLPSHGPAAIGLMSLALVFLVFILAGYFDVMSLPSWSMFVFGIGAFVAVAGAVFFFSPDSNDPDDDGARI